METLGKYSIGIDIGSTFTRSAICRHSTLNIPDSNGETSSPSIVAFTASEQFFGIAAKNQASKNLPNTIYDMKWLIGRKFEEKEIQENIKRWPFKVEADEEGMATIEITYQGETKKLQPEEIFSIILAKVKENAQAYLKQNINFATVSVPDSFTDVQRGSIKKAGKLVGLNIIDFLPESVACIMGLKAHNKISHDKKNFFVLSIGSHNTLAALINNDKGILKTVSVQENRNLGGEEFDSKLAEFCLDDYQKKSGHNIKTNMKIFKRLKAECEKAKNLLTNNTQAIIELSNIYEDEDFSLTISRAKFEDICQELFKALQELIGRVFGDSQIEKNSIDDIILAGGTSKISKIKEFLTEYFEGKVPLIPENPEDLVVTGAAYSAGKTFNNDYICEI